MSSSSSSDHESHCYIFGFGSIMNTDTHSSWLRSSSSSNSPGGGDKEKEEVLALKGRHARILRSFGYVRRWNFRSKTGFTALGICRPTNGGHKEEASDINGIIFQLPLHMLPDFDRREVGYDRVELKEGVDFQLLDREDYHGTPTNKDPTLFFDNIRTEEKVYVYIPQASSCAEADENYPLLQSYVDTVLQGCLEWGGEKLGEEFVATTDGWSSYFLNDTPSSRRPWLFRKQYAIIDRILSQATHTHYSDRRHPEEFASAFLIKSFRGTWNVPRRNKAFVGRDKQLVAIHSKLTEQQNESIAKVAVAGMGGVGKTQITAEYCYRYYGGFYGLICWLNAEGGQNLVACYRQLMADTTDIDVKDKDTEEILTEVKARLFRSKVNWLLIFDNVEDQTILDKFLPHGSGAVQGHVIITTRVVEPSDHLLQLDCFSGEESVELLCRSAGEQNVSGAKNIQAAHELAASLGHLPLALGMAAAYMQRCDVTCSEYLFRYAKTGSALTHRALLNDYPNSVAQSLSLSLNAIKSESVEAWDVLRLLSWLGPDNITKTLIRCLLNTHNSSPPSLVDSSERESVMNFEAGVAVACTGIASLAVGHAINRRRTGMHQGFVFAAALTLSATAATIFWRRTRSKSSYGKLNNGAIVDDRNNAIPTSPLAHRESSNNYSPLEYEKTDEIWNILKSFSILVVRGGQGSIHRLLGEAIRAAQGKEECQRSLHICVRAMLHLWTFSSSNVETWVESEKLLEHVKSVAQHVSGGGHTSMSLEASRLSKEAAVFSAMVLNRFEEAHVSLELSLEILGDYCQKTKRNGAYLEAQSEALHELGRNFRYQGQFDRSEEVLKDALSIRKKLAHNNNVSSRQRLAETLYELGVLEVKKHQLESAELYLQQALTLRRSLDLRTDPSGEVGATLHQLAAVEVQKKPPKLEKAEFLLQEALGLRMQIGQRAATLKQLARVCIRQGHLEKAGSYLAQALELYFELYGENARHINIAAVKFQLGALSCQQEQLDQAWTYFTECLQIRKCVYAYARRIDTNEYPAHLDVSAVLHELACVAFAQKRYEVADKMLRSEKELLERLNETASQPQRIHQALLTNLAWLKKCAIERGDDEGAKAVLHEISILKKTPKRLLNDDSLQPPAVTPDSLSIQHEAIVVRSTVRRFALASVKKRAQLKSQVLVSLDNLRDVALSSTSDGSRKMSSVSIIFRDETRKAIELGGDDMRSMLLHACDELRNALREQGVLVEDKVRK